MHFFGKDNRTMIEFASKNGLDGFFSDILPVPHIFTSRIGGRSTEKPFASLNLGVNTKDLHYRENYEIVKKAMGFDKIVFTKQLHTDVVEVVDETNAADCKNSFDYGVDGVVTNRKNLALCAFTADCVPVLLYDPTLEVIGAVHSGWRGTVKKISVNAVRLMEERFGCKPENIIAAIGPSIGKCCFEIGADAAVMFEDSHPKAYGDLVKPCGDKFFADVAGFIENDLKDCGLEKIDRSTVCTKCRNDLLFSHRCGDGGRQCGFIMMKG